MFCLGDVFVVQQRDELGILIEHVDREAHQVANSRHGIAQLDFEIALVIADRRVHRLENGREQPVLALEIVIDHVLAATVSRGDRVDACPSQAVRRKLAHRGREDLLSRQLGIARRGVGFLRLRLARRDLSGAALGKW